MPKTKKTSMACITAGLLLSVVVSMILAACAATLILKEYMGIEKTDYMVMAVQYISVAVGAVAASKMSMKAHAVISGIVMAIYLFILVAVNILFLQGGMSRIWSGLLASVMGWATACAICILKPSKKKYRKVLNR